MDSNVLLSIHSNSALSLIRISSLSSSIPSTSKFIISNNSLAILDLSLLNDISGELLIENNTISEDVRLFILNTLSGNLTINNNLLLQNLYFYFLTSLTGNLIISGNDNLQNLELISFDTFGGSILISQNPMIKTLTLPFAIAQNNPLIMIDSNPQLEVISFPEIGRAARDLGNLSFRLMVINNPKLKLVQYNEILHYYPPDQTFENNGNFTIELI